MLFSCSQNNVQCSRFWATSRFFTPETHGLIGTLYYKEVKSVKSSETPAPGDEIRHKRSLKWKSKKNRIHFKGFPPPILAPARNGPKVQVNQYPGAPGDTEMIKTEDILDSDLRFFFLSRVYISRAFSAAFSAKTSWLPKWGWLRGLRCTQRHANEKTSRNISPWPFFSSLVHLFPSFSFLICFRAKNTLPPN